MPRPYTSDDQTRLDHARTEYASLCSDRSRHYSLIELFDHNSFSMREFCQTLIKNPHAVRAEVEIETFARKHGIWLEDLGDHYNSMNAFLFPSASRERLVTIGIINALAYYLNDTIGRDKIGNLPLWRQGQARCINNRLVRICDRFDVETGSTGADEVALSVLTELRAGSDPQWFARFLPLWRTHVDLAIRDQNARALGYVNAIEEYIENRLHLSGMLHTVALAEYAENSYLDIPKLASAGLADDVHAVGRSCAALGAFVNDLFSFEKEFIDEGSDNNLIAVTILNQPRMALAEAINQVVSLLRRYLVQYFAAAVRLSSNIAPFAGSEPPDSVASFLNSMQAVVQATWKWQSETQRYKRKISIFREISARSQTPAWPQRDPPLL
jgi:hypothetical protein